MSYYKQGIDPAWVKEQLAQAMDATEVQREVLEAIAEGRCEEVRECARLALDSREDDV